MLFKNGDATIDINHTIKYKYTTRTLKELLLVNEIVLVANRAVAYKKDSKFMLRQIGKKINLSFIDIKKAFDRIKRNDV